MPSPIVAARDLQKVREQSGSQEVILHGVSLHVDPGEFVCVMGPSGSGKSTLLHLLSGLDTPSSGTVQLGGKDLSSLSDAERTVCRRDTVGYVFQFFNLMPNLSVEENIAIPRAIHGAGWHCAVWSGAGRSCSRPRRAGPT